MPRDNLRSSRASRSPSRRRKVTLRSDALGDQAYWKEADRQRFRAAGVRYRVNRRGTARRPLTDHQKKINQSRSRHRARGEHAFRIVKQLWGFTKVRYRWIAKNAARALPHPLWQTYT